jgi:hypothetical protein
VNLKAFDAYCQTKLGLLILGLVELALAYGAASWAIDSGNLLVYLLTLVLLVASIHDFAKLLIRLVLPK